MMHVLNTLTFQSSDSIESGKQGDNLPRSSDRRSKNVHVGVGCDSCGVNSLLFHFLCVRYSVDSSSMTYLVADLQQTSLYGLFPCNVDTLNQLVVCQNFFNAF